MTTATASATANSTASGGSNSGDDGLFPIAMLIDELRNDDVHVRLASIRKLTTISLVLGAERTRTELMPFITDTIYDEDEVLLAMAEELRQFVPLVGGPEFAPCLLPPLETLSCVEETVVRDKAVESLCEIAKDHSTADLEKDFVPLIKRLATGEWFTSRTSACGLFACVYSRLNTATRSEMRTLFRQLVNDDTPMVRRAAAARLGDLFQAAELAEIKSDLISLLPVVAQDEHDSVRMLAMSCCVVLARILPRDDVRAHVMPVVKAGAEDKSWRVRSSLAEVFTDLQAALAKCTAGQAEAEVTEMNNALVGVFLTLLRDPEGEVRSAAVAKLRRFCEQLAPPSGSNTPSDSGPTAAIIVAQLLPVVKELVQETNMHVKTALASQLMALAPFLGKERTQEHLMPLFMAQLRDENPEVRLNVISNLDAVCEVMSVREVTDTLLPVLLQLAEDSKWRVRLAVIERLPTLASQLSPGGAPATTSSDSAGGSGVEQVAPLCTTRLVDTVHAVREAAVANLARLIDRFGAEWAQQAVFPKVIQLSRDPNYLHRMTCLSALVKISEIVPKDVVQKNFISILVLLAADPVPNVRFKTAQSFAKIGQKLDPSVINTSVKPALEKMKGDSDFDVSYFASTAMTELKIVK